MEGTYTRLGDPLQLAYDRALRDWRAEHAPSTPVDELLAGPVTNVMLQLLVFSGGRANITVTISARRSHETSVFFFVLRRRGGVWAFAS